MLEFTQQATLGQTTVSKSEQELLAEWNNTQSTYSTHQCVHQLFEVQVERTPDALVVSSQEGTLTYQELNEKANQVAHHLQRRGVGPEALVGICLDRSLDMIVCLLGILKAGGVYLPFDPSYPVERLSFMLKDSQASLLITQEKFVEHFYQFSSSSVIRIDTDWLTISQEEVRNPESNVTSKDCAYVVYTSGSTGQPKGVQITHESLLNLVFWHQRAFEVTTIDRATQLSSPAFDATGWEIWPYLTHGASVHLVDEDMRTSPLLLRDWLLKTQITISFMPTILAERMISLDWPAETSLRMVLTGADRLQHYPPATLPFTFINNYGPTEATVVATSGPIMPSIDASTAPSIGRPISNTHIFLLDEQLHQVPVGATGELYIGGAGLAKGYLNRPALTAEKFIDHPFSQEPGARLYKTGDLAYYLADGQIAFVGRADYQVKIRGFRIEPGEIEAALQRHPAIQQAVVSTHADARDEKYLVAYIVVDQSISAERQDTQHLTSSELQQFLRSHLPDYMIPPTFVLLAALPLTPHGKIDRAALPAPDKENMMRQQEHVTTKMTPFEEKLADIIAKLLDLEHVGLDDNFFMLGGHSLLGTQMIARVAETFGVNLTLRTLFDAPTVRLLSSEIEKRILDRILAMSEDEAQNLLKQ